MDSGQVIERYKATKKVEQTFTRQDPTLTPPQVKKGDIVDKSKNKAKKFLKLDRLGMRIAHAQKYFTRQRKERAARAFERSLLQPA